MIQEAKARTRIKCKFFLTNFLFKKKNKLKILREKNEVAEKENLENIDHYKDKLEKITENYDKYKKLFDED